MLTELCEVTNNFDALRQQRQLGSDGWTALTELVAALDDLIDRLIDTDGIEEDG